MMSSEMKTNGGKEKLILSISTVAVVKLIGIFLLVAVICSVYGVRALMTKEAARKEAGDGTRELNKILEKDGKLIREYNWVDKDSGRVSIPVQRAMELLLQEPAEEEADTGEVIK
jgi:hypothetical protein